MHKVHIAKDPLWYGFVGNESYAPQNRTLPDWEGITQVGTINLSGLATLKAGSFKGSIGAQAMSGLSARAMDDIVLKNMGLTTQGLKGLGAGSSTDTSLPTTGAAATSTATDWFSAITGGGASLISAIACAASRDRCPSSSTDTAAATTESANANEQLLAYMSARDASDAARRQETLTYVAVGVGAVALLGLGYILLKK